MFLSIFLSTFFYYIFIYILIYINQKRVARFGVAIVPSGTMRLKAKEYSKDLRPVGV